MNDNRQIVYDDGDIRRETEDWAYGEVGSGRTPEAVAADLVASGWSTQDAEDIAETARQKTRHLRGVTTRQDVARGAEKQYRIAMREMPVSGQPGSFGVLGSIIRFLWAGKSRPKSNRGRDYGTFKPDE